MPKKTEKTLKENESFESWWMAEGQYVDPEAEKSFARAGYLAGQRNPDAGYTHPLDRAFYKETVRQRDNAWATIKTLEAKVKELEGKLHDTEVLLEDCQAQYETVEEIPDGD